MPVFRRQIPRGGDRPAYVLSYGSKKDGYDLQGLSGGVDLIGDNNPGQKPVNYLSLPGA